MTEALGSPALKGPNREWFGIWVDNGYVIIKKQYSQALIIQDLQQSVVGVWKEIGPKSFPETWYGRTNRKSRNEELTRIAGGRNLHQPIPVGYPAYPKVYEPSPIFG